MSRSAVAFGNSKTADSTSASASGAILGFIKAGVIGDYVPNCVIKGMLAAIGLILILKQFPHLIGYDANFEGDESFKQSNERGL